MNYELSSPALGCHPEFISGSHEIPKQVRNDKGVVQDDKKNAQNDNFEKLAKELDIKPRILNLLTEYKDQAFLSQELATIHKNVPIEFDLKEAEWGEYDREKVRELFEELGFHSLLKRFGVEQKEEPKTKQAKEQEKKDEQLKLL